MRTETICVQEGYKPKNGEPGTLPIYQSVTCKYDSSETLGQLFDLAVPGHMYSKISNPTCEAVENKIAALEGGVGALLMSSGQSATMISVLNIVSAGEHVVCSASVYGGSFNLFHVTMRKMGIDFTFINQDAPVEELQKAFKPNTKAVFTEALANPALSVLDIEKFAKLAHSNNVPLIVDNTFPTPILCNPLKFGADIVTHSTTKYMEGHASAIGGVIVDSGEFDWEANGYKDLTTPDESYHGVVYTRDFGKAAYITKARVQLVRDIGSLQSPFNAFLLNLGLESLFLRIERHSQNALTIAKFLEADERISWVNYPGLESNKYNKLAKKYLPNGAGGVISFSVKGGKEKAVKFMDSLQLAALVVNVVDARTCVLHPTTTTHTQMTDEQLLQSGALPDLIKMSVGIENVGDILDDIKQALEKADNM